ncbi:MAG: hypothetical protein ACXVZQ_10535, partial [Terriglobales bacterium]
YFIVVLSKPSYRTFYRRVRKGPQRKQDPRIINQTSDSVSEIPLLIPFSEKLCVSLRPLRCQSEVVHKPFDSVFETWNFEINQEAKLNAA